ncbi:MAG: hypothetical protein ACTS1Z_00390 [Parasphingopyxis sp.]
MPKPAFAPCWKKAFSSAIDVRKVKKRSRPWARAVAVRLSI